LSGLKIANSQYKLSEFDLEKIINTRVTKSDFTFQPAEIDIFYDSLDQHVKDLLSPDDLCDIDFNNRAYYSFYDMEDGNCLAVDKNQQVYSLIHDAKPMSTKMKTSFTEILENIKNNRFDLEKHLSERYKNNK
jgi:hypothetical protein